MYTVCGRRLSITLGTVLVSGELFVCVLCELVVCLRDRAYSLTHTPIHTYTHTHTHTTRTQTYTHKYKHTHTHVHTRTHMCSHTRTTTYMYTDEVLQLCHVRKPYAAQSSPTKTVGNL